MRRWVDEQFGPVRILREHRGGMSPGCATSLLTADGRTLFIKAVGAELNQQTVILFRSETQVLRQLKPAPYRPTLQAVFDRDDWVALVLDHVPGRYPDLANEADFTAVARLIDTQTAELTPPPPALGELPSLASTARRWARRWAELQTDPRGFLPRWAATRDAELTTLVQHLPDRHYRPSHHSAATTPSVSSPSPSCGCGG